MKASYLVGVFAVLLLAGAGCAGGGTADTNNDAMMEKDGGAVMQDGAYGTWVVTEAEGPYASDNVGTKYTIDKSKSTFTTKKGITEVNGSIESMTDSRMGVKFEGLDTPFYYNYSVDGDTMTLEVENSGGQVLTLERS